MKYKFLVTIILFLSLQPLTSADPEKSMYKKSARYMVDSARKLIEDYQLEYVIPEVSIAISKRGVIQWAEVSSHPWLGIDSLYSLNTPFRSGSISKLITTMAFAKLYEEGLLHPDSSIHKYVPYFPKKKYDFSIRHILTHTSGIRHYHRDFRAYQEFYNRFNFPNTRSGLRMFDRDTLLFQPGSKRLYSTYSFTLLAAAIEEASGKIFTEYVDSAIFIPLKMNNSIAEYPDSNIHMARCYKRYGDRAFEAPWVNNSYKYAGGGFLSTPLDLLKFGNALIENTLVSRDTRSILVENQQFNDGSYIGQGLGWMFKSDYKGNPYLCHSGSSVGARAYLMVYPRQEIVIAFTMNSDSCMDIYLIEKIANLFINKKV